MIHPHSPTAYKGPGASLIQGWSSFWFSPTHPAGLHVVRVLSGLLFLGWLLGFAGHQRELFSLDGVFDAQAYREAGRFEVSTPAPIGWSLLYVFGRNAASLDVFYYGSLVVLGLFTLGIATRLTGVLTWLIVASFLANPATSFDGDYLLNLLAFYLMLGYLFLGQWAGHLSWRQRLLGAYRYRGSSHAANLMLRLIQVHFAIILIASGMHKMQFGDWWAGVAYWYPLNPPLEITKESLRAHAADAQGYLVKLSLLQYIALAWQLTFPLWAWRKSWRPVLLVGAAIGWIGSLAIYRHPLFGPVLFIACISFVTASEWQRLASLLRPRQKSPVPSRVQGGPVHV